MAWKPEPPCMPQDGWTGKSNVARQDNCIPMVAVESDDAGTTVMDVRNTCRWCMFKHVRRHLPKASYSIMITELGVSHIPGSYTFRITILHYSRTSMPARSAY